MSFDARIRKTDLYRSAGKWFALMIGNRTANSGSRYLGAESELKKKKKRAKEQESERKVRVFHLRGFGVTTVTQKPHF
jgi:hypothetical protein